MTLSEQDVQHLATLSRITLSGEELQHFPSQLGDILSFVKAITSADLPDTVTRDMTNHNTMRDDVIVDKAENIAVVAEFPEKNGDLLSVPKIL